MTAKQRQARAKFKAVVKEASKLRKKNPKLTQAQAVKQAWAISYSKKSKGTKLGAVKKKSATKVKAKKSKSTEMHTDTKSHNVNIRVVSGIGAISDAIMHTIKLYDNKREYHEKQYKFWMNNAKQYPKDKKQSLKYARENKNLVTYYTKQIAKMRLKIK